MPENFMAISEAYLLPKFLGGGEDAVVFDVVGLSIWYRLSTRHRIALIPF
jgi:hypothetical protein